MWNRRPFGNSDVFIYTYVKDDSLAFEFSDRKVH